MSIFSLASFLASAPSVAFSGSRHSSSAAAASCRAFLRSLPPLSCPVAVGCASGIDRLIRCAFSPVAVFRVFPPLSRYSFIQRSTRLVRWCTSGGGVLVAFPSGSCPSAVSPSPHFRGCGSGTWGSVALALGLRCSVLVVLPSPVGCSFPAPSPVASRFHCVGVAPCGGSLWLSL